MGKNTHKKSAKDRNQTTETQPINPAQIAVASLPELTRNLPTEELINQLTLTLKFNELTIVFEHFLGEVATSMLSKVILAQFISDDDTSEPDQNTLTLVMATATLYAFLLLQLFKRYFPNGFNPLFKKINYLHDEELLDALYETEKLQKYEENLLYSNVAIRLLMDMTIYLYAITLELTLPSNIFFDYVAYVSLGGLAGGVTSLFFGRPDYTSAATQRQKKLLNDLAYSTPMDWKPVGRFMAFSLKFARNTYDGISIKKIIKFLTEALKEAQSDMTTIALADSLIVSNVMLDKKTFTIAKHKFQALINEAEYLKRNSKHYDKFLNNLLTTNDKAVSWLSAGLTTKNNNHIFITKSSLLSDLPKNVIKEIEKLLIKLMGEENIEYKDQRIWIYGYHSLNYDALASIRTLLTKLQEETTSKKKEPTTTQQQADTTQENYWTNYFQQKARDIARYVPALNHFTSNNHNENNNVEAATENYHEAFKQQLEHDKAAKAPFFHDRHQVGFFQVKQSTLDELPDQGKYFKEAMIDHLKSKDGHIIKLSKYSNMRAHGYKYKIRLWGAVGGDPRAYFKQDETLGCYNVHIELKHKNG